MVEFFENTISQRKLAESKPQIESKIDFFPDDTKCPGLPHHTIRVNKISWWRMGPWSWGGTRPSSFATDGSLSQRKVDMPQVEQDRPSLATDTMGEFLKDIKSRIDQPHQHAITSQVILVSLIPMTILPTVCSLAARGLDHFLCFLALRFASLYAHRGLELRDGYLVWLVPPFVTSPEMTSSQPMSI